MSSVGWRAGALSQPAGGDEGWAGAQAGARPPAWQVFLGQVSNQKKLKKKTVKRKDGF